MEPLPNVCIHGERLSLKGLASARRKQFYEISLPVYVPTTFLLVLRTTTLPFGDSAN
jgi:hypothetical protein